MNDDAILAQMPIDRLTCFSDEKGAPSDKVKTRQGKLLIALWPLLSKRLKPDERILYVVMAEGPFCVWDEAISCVLVFTTKHIFRVPAKPTAGTLVFTTELIAHCPIEIDNSVRQDPRRIPYTDIQSFTVVGLLYGLLSLSYADGRYAGYQLSDWDDQYKISLFLPRYIACNDPARGKVAGSLRERRKEEK